MIDAQSIINDYIKGSTFVEIEEKYCISDYKIKKILLENDIKLRVRKKVPLKLEKRIVKLYLSGLPASKIAEIVGFKWRTIYDVLKRNEIERRPATIANRTYPINEHYFDTIDTEEKAYFFGLLFADGTINDKLNVVRIQLQNKDKYILEKLMDVIQPTKELYFIEETHGFKSTQSQWCAHFNSVHMGEVLNLYGLIPRKSLVKTFPEIILNSSEDVKRHFIRGYFDGNGCIKGELNKNNFVIHSSFDISSTYEMCSSIKLIIENKLEISTLKIKKANPRSDKNTYRLYTNHKYDCIKIYDWLYYNANIYIERKYEKYKLYEIEKVKQRNENRY